MPSVAKAQTEQQQVEAQEAQATNCNDLTGTERDACLAHTPEVVPGSTAGVGEKEMIIVTGSRIPRTGFDTNQPAIVIGGGDIEARGFSTVGEALNELPAFGEPGSSPIGDTQSNYVAGATFVNFLGLGSNRTLTLVNGRRFVGSNTSALFGVATGAGNQVDTNLLPTFLIDRVETVAVVGAPIYGSDAIAGTVNVILKRKYEGYNLDADSTISDRGDAKQLRVRALAGWNFADGRANLTLAGEYSKKEGLVFNDRPASAGRGEFLATPRDPNSTAGFEVYDDSTMSILSEFGVPTLRYFFPLSREQEDFLLGGIQIAFRDAQGRPLRFDARGNLVPLNVGLVPGPDQGNLEFFNSGGNGFEFDSVSNLLTPLERYNAVGLAQYELNDNIRLFGELWYTRSQGTNQISQPYFNTPAFGGPGQFQGAIPIRADNPFLSAEARAIIQTQALPLAVLGGAQGFYLHRANVDISPNSTVATTEVQRYVIGLDGTVTGFDGHEWSWEVFGNYGVSETNSRRPQIAHQNLFNAINPIVDSSGNIVCRPGIVNSNAQTISSTCAPINLFGFGQASQAALDYITVIATPRSLNKQKDFVASISGTAFENWAGNVGFALGYEHREESQDFDPGDFFYGDPDPNPTVDSNNDGIPDNDRVSYQGGIVVFPVFGKFNTDEVFGELNIPLVSPEMGVPVIRLLEVQGAGRYVHNSAAGGDFTYTAGGRFQPVRDVEFRGNYTQAIRAPAVSELFVPNSPASDIVADPCENSRVNAGPNPTVRVANCAAAGIPVGSFTSTTDQATLQMTFVGNPNLRNETAKSFTLGAVLRPRFIPGFTASIDYIDVTLKDAIANLTPSQIAASCYDTPNYPSEFCASIGRDMRVTIDGLPNPAYRQINQVSRTYFNAAEYEYQAVLVDLDYKFRTPFLGANSRMGIGISYQWLDKFTLKSTGLSVPDPQEKETGYSEHQANARLNYGNGPLNMQLSANYIGEAYFSNPRTDIVGGDKVDDVVYFNSYISYDLTKRLGLRFIVNNLSDTGVPDRGIVFGGLQTYFPGVMGRTFNFGANIKF